MSDGRGGERLRVSEGVDEDQDPMDLLNDTTPRKTNLTVRFARETTVLDGPMNVDAPAVQENPDKAHLPHPHLSLYLQPSLCWMEGRWRSTHLL
ncbi:hypothetical protein HGRIS_001414 [Hohenbuehelia grisea]|uniref:Uncharacterized protein n=1 Tax=Hohenbuehelia grisea TaxID=104357 RepID=A0ABR3JQL0_9AGAR